MAGQQQGKGKGIGQKMGRKKIKKKCQKNQRNGYLKTGKELEIINGTGIATTKIKE